MKLTVGKLGQFIGQAIIYTGFAIFLGVFANSPSYTRIPDGSALIKLSFAHSARAKGECRQLTAEELENLAPNMRKKERCARERLPVHIKLLINEEILVDELLQPTGLHSDGPSRIYERIIVPSGQHEIAVFLRDTTRQEGFDHIEKRSIDIKPGQSLAIDFHGDDGFIFQ